MDSTLQWVITTLVAIIGIIAGRVWERHDYRLKKDRLLLDDVLKIVPKGSETYLFLKHHDFGDAFTRDPLKPLRELELLLDQPGTFFLNKHLEKMKQSLLLDIKEFDEILIKETFPHEVARDFYELPKPDTVLIARANILGKQRRLSEQEFDQLNKDVRSHYEQTRQKLNSQADSICKMYDALVSKAHKIL